MITIEDREIESLDDALRGTFEAAVAGKMRTVAVPGAAPGDRLDVSIVAVSQHNALAYGEVGRVVARGDQFVAPACPHAAPLRGDCGGCPAMHLSKKLREEAKFSAATEVLEPLGAPLSWHGAPSQTGYRNRSNFVATTGGDGLVLGSYARRSQKVATMTGCLVVRPAIAEVHGELEVLLSALKIPTGDAAGALRWVSMREARGDVVVELIVADESAPWIDEAINKIAAIDAVSALGISVNEGDTNAIRQGPTKIVDGDGILSEEYGQVSLAIPPGAFAQLNVDVASRIYDQAREWAGEVDGASVFWDLYCGIGGLGLNGAAPVEGARLWGLEEVAAAVDGARKNSEKCGVDATFSVVDLDGQQGLAQLAIPDGLEDPQVVLINPPRKGMSKALRQWLLENAQKAQKIIYMSCDAASFARDIKELSQGPWTLREVQVHDMLPMTGHVELLGYLD